MQEFFDKNNIKVVLHWLYHLTQILSKYNVLLRLHHTDILILQIVEQKFLIFNALKLLVFINVRLFERSLT